MHTYAQILKLLMCYNFMDQDRDPSIDTNHRLLSLLKQFINLLRNDIAQKIKFVN